MLSRATITATITATIAATLERARLQRRRSRVLRAGDRESAPGPARLPYSRSATLGGLTVASIGAIALIGWLTGSRTLSAVRPGFIPVAPNTAVLFVLLGASLCTIGRTARPAVLFTRSALGFSLLVSGTRLAEYLFGASLGVDRWMFSVPSETLGLAPVGKMAFFTALSFVLACAALLVQNLPGRPRYADDLARTPALLVTLIGLVFSLGYLYRAPLLYGSRSVPMALPTAVAFVVLGLSIAVPAILRDHAQRREAERALRAAHDDLEHRVAERTVELEAANEELQDTVAELEEQTAAAELARQEARAAEQQYRTLVDGVAIGVVLTSAQGIETSNPSAERILGLTTEGVRGQATTEPEWRAIHEDGSPFPEESHPMAVSLRTGVPQRNVAMGVHRPDGTLVWIEVSSDPLFRPGEATPYAVVSSFADVTERRQLEEQLRQAQKMEAIGQLAGGVAHDFNNLLTAITSYSELVLMDPALPDWHRKDVGEIGRAADRAATLTRQLLAFSRQQVLQPQSLELNRVVADVENMLGRLIGEDVRLRTTLDPALGCVMADPGQLEQVLVNLAVNARDAMPDGGTLTIETANVELDEDDVRQHAHIAPGSYVKLAVGDTGCGMSSETQARIFEPFFTTKRVGKGTGLGLSTVYGIVKQSGGQVRVESAPGAGTTFEIYLPRVDAAVGEAAPSSSSAAPGPACGAETILLVEDDEMLRRVSARILRDLGYTVLEATNGVEALAACAAATTPDLDLVISDLVMPEMGGHELAQRLRELLPGTPLLQISGYSREAVSGRGFVDPGADFLEKPFTPDALARKVRQLLDASPRSALRR